jgi:hypothetical protein
MAFRVLCMRQARTGSVGQNRQNKGIHEDDIRTV